MLAEQPAFIACTHANRTPRFRGMSPYSYDDEKAPLIRKQFFTKQNLAQSYAFCLHLCRYGNLPAAKFQSMLRRADIKRVWAYSGIQVWSIPYILLALENFSAITKGGGTYEFHFVFKKPSKTNISVIWEGQQPCTIRKVFSNNGNEVQASDNPFPVSKKDFVEKAGDTSWINLELLLSLIPATWEQDRDRIRY